MTCPVASSVRAITFGDSDTECAAALLSEKSMHICNRQRLRCRLLHADILPIHANLTMDCKLQPPATNFKKVGYSSVLKSLNSSDMMGASFTAALPTMSK